MDIDDIREMIRAGQYEVTIELDRRMNQREVTLEQIKQCIESGRIVREERRQKRGYVKCTILGYAERWVAGIKLPGLFPLCVACAMGRDEIVLITAYWQE
jgi:hypothetical protein